MTKERVSERNSVCVCVYVNSKCESEVAYNVSYYFFVIKERQFAFKTEHSSMRGITKI